MACLFRKSVKKGWPSVHDHWECRAGSQEPCQITEYRGSVEDTRSLYVISLYPVLLEQIREWCVQHPDLEAQYNQDLPDCREQLSVRCTPNRAGKQAKQELIREFKLDRAEDIKAQRGVSFAGMKFPVEEDQAEEQDTQTEVQKVGDEMGGNCGSYKCRINTHGATNCNRHSASFEDLDAEAEHCGFIRTDDRYLMWKYGAPYKDLQCGNCLRYQGDTHGICTKANGSSPGGNARYSGASAGGCNDFKRKPVEEDQAVDQEEAPAWKPRCPYLASLGQKHVTCSVNSHHVHTERFDTAQELNAWLEDVCEGNFEKCPNYEIGYESEKKYKDRGCIFCCNNTWHTGLKPGENGQEVCFCQIKKQPMPHHEKCEWYNKIYRETEVEKVNELCKFYGKDTSEDACYKQEDRENEFCMEAGQDQCRFYHRQAWKERKAAQEETVVADQGEYTLSDRVEEETAVAAFDYGAVDADTATYLQDKARTITEIRVKSVITIGRELKETFAKFAKLPYGNRTQLFDQWCESIGFSPRSARNYIQGYEYVAENFGNIDSAPEIQPSLLFAISKPSAPQELQEQVISGDITTYKEYQEAMERIKQVEAERDKMLADNRAMYLDLEAADQRIQHWEKKANRSQQEIEAFRNDVARFKDKISDKDNDIKYLQDKLDQANKAAQVDKPNPAKELELKMLRDQIDALEAERQELQERLEEKPIDVGEVIKEVIKEKEVIPEDLKLATWTLVDDLLTNLIDLKNIQWTVFIDHLSTDDCLEYSKVIDHQIIPRLSAMAARMRCRLS
jgi:hypothetical protein